MSFERPGLDSLTDIVTNTVGALVVLMVLVSLISAGRVQQIRVPVQHDVLQAPVFFFCKGDQVLEVDVNAVLADLLALALERGPGAVRARQALANTGLIAAVSAKDGLARVQLWPRDSTGWRPARDAARPGTPLRERLDSLDHHKHWAFFWVYPDAHDSFRAVRQLLIKRGIKVGWQPRSGRHPAFICARNDQECALRPM